MQNFILFGERDNMTDIMNIFINVTSAAVGHKPL